jgi:hypothetical protein
MRPLSLLLFFLVALSGGFSQVLDYTTAPKEALGYTFGATEASVTDALKAANTTFRQDLVKQNSGITRVTVANQTLDKLEKATVELQFFKGELFQIGASVPYSAATFQGLLKVLTDKYGAKRSVDGGYHYSWFYYQADHPSANQVPDFALVLASDPLDKKVLTLTYADNARRYGTVSAGPAGASASTPAPAAPTLDPNHF